MRLALPRPADHPLAQMAQAAGWVPVPFSVTRLVESETPPPKDLHQADALVVLSPNGARLVAPHLPSGMAVLAQGPGTAAALGRKDLDLHVAPSAQAEALWDLLRQRFPEGGHFILARGERSREFLETAARESAWSLHLWITHREAPLLPLPELPPVDAVLAMSPLQAQLLSGMAKQCLRFAWGESSAAAFRDAGLPAIAWCEPAASAFQIMLTSSFKEIAR